MSLVSKLQHDKRRKELLERTGKDIGPWKPPTKTKKKK